MIELIEIWVIVTLGPILAGALIVLLIRGTVIAIKKLIKRTRQ